MGFADELKTAQVTPEITTPPPQAEAIPTLPGGPKMPAHGEPYPGTGPEPEVQPEASSAPVKIRIGDREFSSQEEAIIFAREEVARAQGLKQGVEDTLKASQKPQEEAPAVDPMEAQMAEMEELMFTDPKAYNKRVLEMTAKAKEDARIEALNEFNRMTQQQQTQIANQAAYEGYKREFYNKNPDLSDFDDVVEQVILNKQGRYWNDIKDLPLDQAGEKVAQYTRELLRIKKNAESRRTELPSRAAVLPGATGIPSMRTGRVESESSMDFITQMRTLNKKGK